MDHVSLLLESTTMCCAESWWYGLETSKLIEQSISVTCGNQAASREFCDHHLSGVVQLLWITI